MVHLFQTVLLNDIFSCPYVSDGQPCGTMYSSLKNAITGINRGIGMIINTMQATVCHWPVYQ
jgi:hypothetical protein